MNNSIMQKQYNWLHTNVIPANTDEQTVPKPTNVQAKSSVCPIKFMDGASIEWSCSSAFAHTLQVLNEAAFAHTLWTLSSVSI